MGTATATDLELRTPADLEQEVPAILAWARQLQIATPYEYEEAAGRLKTIKGAMKRVADFFRPTKQKLDEAKREVLTMEKKLSDPLDHAERLTKQAMIAYQQAEAAKAAAEQRRLQAEADERARREREALAKKALAAKKPETQQRYQEAAAAITAPVVHVQAETPKVSGIATRVVWKARVIDELEVPREFLAVDLKKLDAFAKAMREGARVPGVEFFTEQGIAAEEGEWPASST